jgi:hypothetical protein
MSIPHLIGDRIGFVPEYVELLKQSSENLINQNKLESLTKLFVNKKPHLVTFEGFELDKAESNVRQV